MKGIYTALIGFLVLCSITTFAQKSQYDFETWTHLTLKANVGEKWSFKIQNQHRLDEISTVMKSNITHLGTGYEINKNWDLGYEFRFIVDYDNRGSDQGYKYYTRHHVDVEQHGKSGRLEVEYRYRFQWKQQHGVESLEQETDAFDHRFRLALGYNIPNWKWDPKISTEAFYHRQVGEINGFDRYRVTLSTRRRLNKKSDLKIKLGMNRKRSVWKPATAFFLSAGYVYEI